jgi:acetyltransferase-like isoleucine patch superfamily enzyme
MGETGRVRRLVWFFQKRLMYWLCPDRIPAAKEAWLRRQGARIGKDCWICSDQVLAEPYLLEIGDHVTVSVGTAFVTHDGSADPDVGIATYGRISVGDETFVGCNCIILPGTIIGRNCIVGAGSVVRGTIPDGTMVMGNPAQVVMTTAMARSLAARNPGRIEARGLSREEVQRVVRRRFGLDPGP